MLIINPKPEHHNGWVVITKQKESKSTDLFADMVVFNRALFDQIGGHESFLKHLQENYVDTGKWESFGKVWPCYIDAWRGEDHNADGIVISEDEKKLAVKSFMGSGTTPKVKKTKTPAKGELHNLDEKLRERLKERMPSFLKKQTKV